MTATGHSMDLDLQYRSPSLVADLHEVAPMLAASGVDRLTIAQTALASEPAYLVAYVDVHGRRQTYSTADLRLLPLVQQERDLVKQLHQLL